MNTGTMANTLTTLFRELVDGATPSSGYMLNGGDVGLLRSLDAVSAEGASVALAQGASVAAHVDHIRYGLSLMNRWSGGENPFRDADWGTSWHITTVSESEWKQLRTDLRDEAHRWLDTLRAAREVSEIELTGMVGSIAHLAYHLGAIRQINRAARGPTEQG